MFCSWFKADGPFAESKSLRLCPSSPFPHFALRFQAGIHSLSLLSPGSAVSLYTSYSVEKRGDLGLPMEGFPLALGPSAAAPPPPCITLWPNRSRARKHLTSQPASQEATSQQSKQVRVDESACLRSAGSGVGIGRDGATGEREERRREEANLFLFQDRSLCCARCVVEHGGKVVVEFCRSQSRRTPLPPFSCARTFIHFSLFALRGVKPFFIRLFLASRHGRLILCRTWEKPKCHAEENSSPAY